MENRKHIDEKISKESNSYKKQSLENKPQKKINKTDEDRRAICFTIPQILVKHIAMRDTIKKRKVRYDGILEKEKTKFHSLSAEKQLNQWVAFFSKRDKKKNFFNLKTDIQLTKSDFLAYMNVIKKIKRAYEQFEPSNSSKASSVLGKIKSLENDWDKSFLRQKNLDITKIKEMFIEQRKVNEERKILLKKAREIIELGDLIEDNNIRNRSSMSPMDLKKEKEEKAFYNRMIALLNQIEKIVITREIEITLDEKLKKELDQFDALSFEEQSKQHAPFWSKRNREIDIAWLKIDIASTRIDCLEDIEAIKKIKQDYTQLYSSSSKHVTNVLGKIKELEDDWNQLLWYEHNADKIPIEEMSDIRKKVKEKSNNILEKIREIIRLENLREEEKINPPPSTHSSENEQIKAIIKKMFEEKKEKIDKKLKEKKEKELNPTSFLYSIKDLPAIYKKLQHCVTLLPELEKLVHLRNKMNLRDNGLEYAETFQKTIHLSDKISETEENAESYLLGLEKSWDSFNRQEKQQINTARDLLIKNSIKALDLKKELVAYKEKNPKKKYNRSADEEKKLEELYPFVKDSRASRQNNQDDLEKTHGRWLMRKEHIEKEEEFINQWLLSCRKKLTHKDYSESDTITAIYSLEKLHIYAEWILFDKKRYGYLLLKKKSHQYEEIIAICEFMQNKMRNLSNRIYAIFGSQIETVRKMIDREEIVVKQPILNESMKSFELFLEEAEQGYLKNGTLKDLLDIQETASLNLKKCEFILSNASLPSPEREQYQQALTLIKAVQECLGVEISQRK